MFPKSDPFMNIAPIYAKCYSFPVSIGIDYWYQGDEKNGTVPVLTDNVQIDVMIFVF